MTWFVGAADVERLFAEGIVRPLDCVDAVERSFREHGSGDVGVLPRAILTADGAAAQPRSRALKLSAAYMRGSRRMGASIYSTHFRPGDVDMWLMVFSGETGDLTALLHGKALSLWKTGATAAVAARHLARPEASRAAIIGTGYYARAQLACLAAVRALEAIACYSRDATGREAFAAWATGAVPHARVVAASSAQEAVEGADLVTTITTSPQPVVSGAWLASGTHVNAMGQHAPATREVDTNAVAKARVFVDAREQAFAEKGEILIPLQAGDISQAHVLGELGEVVAQRVAGRTSPDDVTLFCSGGTALEYMGMCEMIAARAREAGIGHALQ